MVDDRRSDKSIIGPRDADAPRKAERADRETQAFVVSTYGLQRHAGWNLPRAGVRPINLERRARFARFDLM